MRRAAALATFVALTLSATGAAAQHRRRQHRDRGNQASPLDPIEALCADGVEMLDRQQYARAAAFFDVLYQRTREPRALYRLGVAELELGRFVGAELHVRTALQSGNDPWIRAHREGVEQALERAQGRVGDLTVTSNAPNAAVTVNGVATSAFPVRVAAGEARIVVRAPGYETYEATVMVPGNVEEPFHHEARMLPTTVAANARVTTEPSLNSETNAPPATTPFTLPARMSGPLLPMGIGLMAAGGAGLVLGVIGLVLRNAAALDFNADSACGANGGAPVGGPPCSDRYDSVQTAEAMSVAGFVTGGVLAGVGAALFLVAPQQRNVERARLNPIVRPGFSGLSILGRF